MTLIPSHLHGMSSREAALVLGWNELLEHAVVYAAAARSVVRLPALYWCDILPRYPHSPP